MGDVGCFGDQPCASIASIMAIPYTICLSQILQLYGSTVLNHWSTPLMPKQPFISCLYHD